MKRIFYVLFACCLVSLTSCMREGAQVTFPEDVVTMKYSELLTLTNGDGYTLAEIKNPWGKDSTAVLHSYVLVPDSLADKVTYPTKCVTVVKMPLKKAVVYSSVHASLLNEIGAFKDIRGVCDANFMYLDKVHECIKTGAIADCGEGMNPNIEKIMDLQPDAILLSPFENSGTYGKLGKIGIPLVECADYMENSPLGRAEWMKFYGILFGCEKQADSLFADVENNYNRNKTSIKGSDPLIEKSSVSVFTEKKTGDTWYVAGGESYIGNIIADAGGDYVFKDGEPSAKKNGEPSAKNNGEPSAKNNDIAQSAGSLPYNPEVVFDKVENADVWLLKYSQDSPMTLSQLAQEWGAYKSLKAYKTKNVWGCNLSKTLFYEETPFHPDLLLKDYVKIFHPEMLKGYTLRYYQKIQ